MLGKVALLILCLTTSHAMYKKLNYPPCRQSSECHKSKLCVQNECIRYKPNQDCTTKDGKCSRGYCCLILAPDSGFCVKKAYLKLQYGDYCSRSTSCSNCKCAKGLVCAKAAGMSHYPAPFFTCQYNDTDGDCTDDDQCASDRCCSMYRCKPKRREGERCYPKPASESYLKCMGDCIEGTECVREPYGGPGYYECRQTANTISPPSCR